VRLIIGLVVAAVAAVVAVRLIGPRRCFVFIQRLPGVGLVFSMTPGGQLLALRDASCTFIVGTIGAWLAPAIRVMQNARPVTWPALADRLRDASTKGDFLILVPPLIVPLLLLLFLLIRENPRVMRGHQIVLVVVGLILTGISMTIYITRVASQVSDQRFLIGSSTWSMTICLVALYLYFLLYHLPNDFVARLQQEQTDLTDRVHARRVART
jgi:hypothetical protein